MTEHTWVVVISWRQVNKASFTTSLPHHFVRLFCRNEAVSHVIAEHGCSSRNRALLRYEKSHVISSTDLCREGLANIRILEFLDKASHVVQHRNHTSRQHAPVGITYGACTKHKSASTMFVMYSALLFCNTVNTSSTSVIVISVGISPSEPPTQLIIEAEAF